MIRLRNKSAQIIKYAELNHVTWNPLPDFLSGKSRKQMFGEIVCLLLLHSQQFDLWPNTGTNKLCCTEAKTLWNFESLEIKTLRCKSFLINTCLESLRFKKNVFTSFSPVADVRHGWLIEGRSLRLRGLVSITHFAAINKLADCFLSVSWIAALFLQIGTLEN